ATRLYSAYSHCNRPHPPFPTRRSSDLTTLSAVLPVRALTLSCGGRSCPVRRPSTEYSRNRSRPAIIAKNRISSSCAFIFVYAVRSEEHTSELQSLRHLVCRLLLEKKKE